MTVPLTDVLEGLSPDRRAQIIVKALGMLVEERKRMATQSGRKTIPVSAAAALSQKYGFDQVVIIARKIGGGESVTTYGKGRVHKDIAARTGEFLYREVMGWARESTFHHEVLPAKGVSRRKKSAT